MHAFYQNEFFANFCTIIFSICSAFARGDPHLVTLNGLKYTFNGLGEYTLVETTDSLLTLQGRMTLARNSDGTVANATVLSAIAGTDNNSDTVQLEIDRNGTLTVIVSGEHVAFVNNTEQEFEKVTVKRLANNTLEVRFESGVYFMAKAENGFISSLRVILPETYISEVQGLLGTYNGNISHDLLPRFGNAPLPPDSSPEDIHNNFGVTCELSRSLFAVALPTELSIVV